MFSELFFPYVLGGGERQFFELARRLAKKHEVHVYTMSLEGAKKYQVYEGIHIHRLGFLKHPLHERSLLPLITYFLSSFFRRVSADVIHTNTYLPCISGYFKAKVSGKPIVATIHDVYRGVWGETMGHRILGSIGNSIENIVCRLNYDRIISVSSATKRALMRYFDVPGEKINVIPNGIDIRLIDSIKVRGVKNKICYVGRLIPHKHVDELIRAINLVKKSLPNIECDIIGGGFLRDDLEKLVKKLGLEDNVKFLGVLPSNEDALKVMKSSEVFVMPSTREGFGIAVLEAMRCGCVPIAYKQKCYDDFCTKKNSLLLNRGVYNLSKAIVGLLKNKKKVVSMRKDGFNTAGRFGWDTIVKDVENIYWNVVE